MRSNCYTLVPTILYCISGKSLTVYLAEMDEMGIDSSVVINADESIPIAST